jgi:hypothetical protein
MGEFFNDEAAPRFQINFDDFIGALDSEEMVTYIEEALQRYHLDPEWRCPDYPPEDF